MIYAKYGDCRAGVESLAWPRREWQSLPRIKETYQRRGNGVRQLCQNSPLAGMRRTFEGI